jgi:hypothetical protein
VPSIGTVLAFHLSFLIISWRVIASGLNLFDHSTAKVNVSQPMLYTTSKSKQEHDARGEVVFAIPRPT